MNRQIYALVGIMIGLIVLPITLFVAYSVAGPFFASPIGTTEHAVYGFSGADIINFGGAITIFVLALIAFPVVLALKLLVGGNPSGVRGR